MQLPFFYHADDVFNDAVTLSDETSKHIVQVLRMKEGDKVQITNGKGVLITGAIATAHKKHTELRVLEKTERPATKQLHTVGISILKNSNRLEWFMEKATELGIAAIIPLLCERTEKTAFRYERMNSILISAMLQSRQTYLPKLHAPIKFNEYLSMITDASALYIAHCYEEEKQLFKNIVSANTSKTILIGPEGDFTPQEVNEARQRGFEAVSLGQTRLRTETAAVAAAVLMCM